MSDELANGMHDDLAPFHDPRHVALNARDVMRPCGWAKSKDFQNLKNRDLVAPPVMTHPDRWRLARFLRPLHASDAHIPLRTSALRSRTPCRAIPTELPGSTRCWQRIKLPRGLRQPKTNREHVPTAWLALG